MEIPELKTYDILILPSYLIDRLLEQETQLHHPKYMTLEEWKNHVLYTYSKETIYDVMTSYHVTPEIAELYIKHTYYVENKKYQSEKLNFLVSLKEELKKKQLLTYYPFFEEVMKKKKIGIFGYDQLPLFEQNLLTKYHVEKIVDEKKSQTSPIPFYLFSNIEEEVEFVANEILALLEKKIPITKIKLIDVPKEYFSPLKRIFSLYQIPLNLNRKIPLFSTNIGAYFYRTLDFEALEKLFPIKNQEEQKIKEKIVSILNQYPEIKEKKKELLQYDLRNATIEEPRYKEAVELTSCESCFVDDYLFLLGANQGVFPHLYQDEDYLNDEEKKEVGLDDTVTKNEKEKNKWKQLCKYDPHLIITAKKKTPFQTYEVSSFLKELQVEKQEPNKTRKFHYSSLYDKIKVTKWLDQYSKYGRIEDHLQEYFYQMPDLPYKTYQNQYQKIEKETLFHRLHHHLNLSYSTLDQYYRCPFRYYVSNILKCDPYEETFFQYVGTLYHEVLATYEEKPLEKILEEFQKNHPYPLSKKEAFFLKKFKKNLVFLLETLEEQKKKSSLNQSKKEKKVMVPIKREIPVTFTGIIDKVMYLEKEGHTYGAIVDYKTGNPSFHLEYLPYGIEMQLPIYLFLAQHMELFHDFEPIGFYLQKVFLKEPIKTKGKTKESMKKEALRLQGYTIDDPNLIRLLDQEFENSTVIRGMKTTKQGFYPYTKVLRKEEMKDLEVQVEKKINEATDQILNAEFPIQPKVIDGTHVGCEFCTYQDICFKEEENYLYVDKVGEKDA